MTPAEPFPTGGAVISDHAAQRLKERLGWNASAQQRMANLALERGLKHTDTSGRLRRYFDKLFLSHGSGNNTRIYGEHVYIIQGQTVVTVLHLPNDLKRAARQAAGKR